MVSNEYEYDALCHRKRHPVVRLRLGGRDSSHHRAVVHLPAPRPAANHLQTCSFSTQQRNQTHGQCLYVFHLCQPAGEFVLVLTFDDFCPVAECTISISILPKFALLNNGKINSPAQMRASLKAFSASVASVQSLMGRTVNKTQRLCPAGCRKTNPCRQNISRHNSGGLNTEDSYALLFFTFTHISVVLPPSRQRGNIHYVQTRCEAGG